MREASSRGAIGTLPSGFGRWQVYLELPHAVQSLNVHRRRIHSERVGAFPVSLSCVLEPWLILFFKALPRNILLYLFGLP